MIKQLITSFFITVAVLVLIAISANFGSVVAYMTLWYPNVLPITICICFALILWIFIHLLVFQKTQ